MDNIQILRRLFASYKLLGVDLAASPIEIKKAYRIALIKAKDQNEIEVVRLAYKLICKDGFVPLLTSGIAPSKAEELPQPKPVAEKPQAEEQPVSTGKKPSLVRGCLWAIVILVVGTMCAAAFNVFFMNDGFPGLKGYQALTNPIPTIVKTLAAPLNNQTLGACTGIRPYFTKADGHITISFENDDQEANEIMIVGENESGEIWRTSPSSLSIQNNVPFGATMAKISMRVQGEDCKFTLDLK